MTKDELKRAMVARFMILVLECLVLILAEIVKDKKIFEDIKMRVYEMIEEIDYDQRRIKTINATK